MGKYRDFDALAYEPKIQGDDDHIAMNHVTKRHKKDKGIEVVFDPAHHKEFITGFRKRKQQRRNKAIKQLEDKAKQERLEFRAEKRAKLKEQLGLDDRWGVDSSDSEDKKARYGRPIGDVKSYADQGVTTTVTTIALDSGPESSDEDDDDAEEAVGASASFQKRGSSSSAHGGGRVRTGPVAPNGQGKSKAALAWSRKHGGREGRKDKGEGAANRLQKLTSKMKRGRGGKGRDGGGAKSKKKK